MNFRERQLRQISQNQIKLLEQTQQELQKQKQRTKDKQKNINEIINLLGSEADSLTSITNLLKGQTLKELSDYKTLLTQKIKDQDTALISLAKQKLKGKKEAETLLTELEKNWKKKEQIWQENNQNLGKHCQQIKDQQSQLEKKHQEQLRTINLIYDENASSYKEIDFKELMKLLETKKTELEQLAKKSKSFWSKS